MPRRGRTGVVIYVRKYDVHREKRGDHLKWAASVNSRLLAVPGILEIRVFRTAVGASQMVATAEFADLAAWAEWYGHEEVQTVFSEAREYLSSLTTELWGPSPVHPEPVRPS
jgi:heme-degrading monooxygenase HmoA